MKKIILSSVACLLLACMAVGCTSSSLQEETQASAQQTETEAAQETDPVQETQAETEKVDNSLPKDKEYSILFIGNSYTYCNDMPHSIFKPLCDAAGYNVKVDSVTRGGYYLHQFANQNDEYGKKVLEKLENNTYDYVVIQEQSGNAVKNPSSFFSGVRAISRLLRRYHDGELVLFQTWGYKTGYHLLPTHGGDTETMELKLRAAYTAIGEELSAKVALVGVAFLDVHRNSRNMNIYDADCSHPAQEGSVIAACTIFSTIFQSDVRGIKFDAGVDARDLGVLQEAAYKATFEDHPVPDRHKFDMSEY